MAETGYYAHSSFSSLVQSLLPKRALLRTYSRRETNVLLLSYILKQNYQYYKLRKAFSKFYHGHSELIVKYYVGLNALLQQCITEPVLYGDLVYGFKRIFGNPGTI